MKIPQVRIYIPGSKQYPRKLLSSLYLSSLAEAALARPVLLAANPTLPQTLVVGDKPLSLPLPRTKNKNCVYTLERESKRLYLVCATVLERVRHANDARSWRALTAGNARRSRPRDAAAAAAIPLEPSYHWYTGSRVDAAAWPPRECLPVYTYIYIYTYVYLQRATSFPFRFSSTFFFLSPSLHKRVFFSSYRHARTHDWFLIQPGRCCSSLEAGGVFFFRRGEIVYI